MALCVTTVVLVVGCESTGRRSSGRGGGSSGDGSANVRIEGADGTVSGDTITIQYPESDDINDRIPDWVINPAMGGVTGAIGVAPHNDLGIREQLDEARLNGRLELVSMLELRVQRVGRSELEQDVRVERDQHGDRSRRNTLGIDRNILDSVLAGSRQRALWFDKNSGECYVWMVLDGALLARVEHQVSKDVSVFIANQALPSEYRPERKKLEPPTVVVEMPDAPAPEPQPEAPEPPKGPVEELEDTLKPIETIPVDSSDDGQ